MTDIIIRDATIQDLEQLYLFEQGVIEAERPFDPSLKKEKINYYDINEMIHADYIKLIIAELDGKLVGSGYGQIEKSKPYQLSPEYLYLGFMYVVPEHRGKGINKRIIEALKNWASAHEIFEARLQVYFDNSSAIRAYEKIGFSMHMIEMRLHIDE